MSFFFAALFFCYVLFANLYLCIGGIFGFADCSFSRYAWIFSNINPLSAFLGFVASFAVGAILGVKYGEFRETKAKEAKLPKQVKKSVGKRSRA